MISALPDWSGRIWFAAAMAWSGWFARRAARCERDRRADRQLVRRRRAGGVYIVTDTALYRFEAAEGRPDVDLAARLREHRRDEAGPDPGRLGDDADGDRRRTSRSPTTPIR